MATKESEEIVPPTGLTESSIKVTHNNDRKHYVIALDDAKEGTTIFNLDPYFKARVGDGNTKLEVVWTHQGRLKIMDEDDEPKPFGSGIVSKYYIDKNHQIQLDPGGKRVDFSGSTEDIGTGGRVDYHFPVEMFPTDGIFKGFIGIQDKYGRVSGVDIWFRVLKGVAQMGTGREVYISELESLKLEYKAKQRAAFAQFNQDVADIKQKMNDTFTSALNDHTKNFDTEMADIKSKLDEANQLAQSILDSDKLLDKALDANTEAIQNKMAPVLNQSNVFTTQNTFQQGALMQNGLTVNGALLVNGVDLSKLADQVNKLQIDVNKLNGGN